MKKSVLACLLSLAFLLAAAGQASAISDAEHRRYLEACPEYATADRELNEAWKKFKSVATKEHYGAMLREQRNFIRNMDEGIRYWRGMLAIYERLADAEIAALVMKERTAIINSSICAYEPDYVAVRMEREKMEDMGRECDGFIPEASRPADFALNYVGLFCGRTRHGQVRDFIARTFDAVPGRYGMPGRYAESRGLEYMYGDDYYYGYLGELRERASDIYSVTFENGRISCLMHTFKDGVGKTTFSLRDTVLYDVLEGRTMKISDLFENPGLAEILMKGLAVEKARRWTEENAAGIVNGDHDASYRNCRLLLGISGIRLDAAVIRNGGFEVEIGVGKRRGGTPYNTCFVSDDNFPPVVSISFSELEAAGLRMEYLR